MPTGPAVNALSRALCGAAEQLQENLHRQEIARPQEIHVSIRRKPTAGHDHVKMRMVQQIGPHVENGGQAGFHTSKMLRVGGDHPAETGDRADECRRRRRSEGNGRQSGRQGR